MLPAPARAWPTADQAVDKLAPYMSMKPDDAETAKFFFKYPSCAATISAYTAEGDYSLAGFIGVLKSSKVKGIPGLPAISKASCKKYNPPQRAYMFIDSKGDELLGKQTADFFRNILADQIAQGKAELDAQIAALPYVGTILANWDCGCDAAFETTFEIEKKLNDGKVAKLVNIIKAILAADFASAVEQMIDAINTEDACNIAAAWSGTGSVPIVSTLATKACSKAGEGVSWVTDKADDALVAVGLKGGDHIPPDQYYAENFADKVKYIKYQETAQEQYKYCYNYFEPTNMAPATAKKVCSELVARYYDDVASYQQWSAADSEKNEYYKTNMVPKANEAALVNDGEFAAIRQVAIGTCANYFSQRYPKAERYVKTYKVQSIAGMCDYLGGSPANKTYGMYAARRINQSFLAQDTGKKLEPLCKHTGPLEVGCQNTQAVNNCRTVFPAICQKSDDEKYKWQAPCCLIRDVQTDSDKARIKNADDIAHKAAPYCFTAKDDPLRIVCTIDAALKACQQNMTSQFVKKDCKDAEKNYFGGVNEICCSSEPEKLEKIEGVITIKGFVISENAKAKGSCTVGGGVATEKEDVRVAYCNSKTMPQCLKTVGGEACAKLPSGYVGATCCEQAGVGSSLETQYDPSQRKPGDLALTEKIVNESHGHCQYVATPAGSPDKFYVKCDTAAAMKSCQAALAKKYPRDCEFSSNGFAVVPCCELSPEAFTGKAHSNDAGKAAGGAPLDGGNAKTGLPVDKPHPQTAQGPTGRGGGTKLPTKVLSIEMLSVKPGEGVNPFLVKDVEDKIDPSHRGPTTLTGASPVTRAIGGGGAAPTGTMMPPQNRAVP